MKKLGILLILFLLCFLGTLSLRKYGLIGGGANEGDYASRKYSLQEHYVPGIDKLTTLQKIDQERTILINSIIPSVVCISTEGFQRIQFNDSRRASIQTTRDEGSGVIVSHEGHIITNNHVVSGKSKFIVSLYDGREYEAKIVGTDPSLDIAVLKIKVDGKGITPLKFGDSDKVNVGQMVFAVGNPFGLGETVTQGIISAKERSFSDQQRDLFQTDAAINPGNSGGPLVNTKGEVIGINVAIYSSKDEKQSSQGLGFSLPSNEVLASFKQIVEKGRPVWGYLGVRLLDLTSATPEIQTYLNYKGDGVAVVGVTVEGPAARSGIRPKDVIISYGGVKPKDRRHLIQLIQQSSINKQTEVEIVRNGEKKVIKVQVINVLDRQGVVRTIEDVGLDQVKAKVGSLGVRVRPLEWVEVRRGYKGVVVYQINPSSIAYHEGFRKGDRILKINGVELLSPDHFYNLLINSKPGDPFKMLVVRKEGEPRELNLKISSQ